MRMSGFRTERKRIRPALKEMYYPRRAYPGGGRKEKDVRRGPDSVRYAIQPRAEIGEKQSQAIQGQP